MPAKIRLARHGRKRYAYYHIMVADSRAPRDGRFIERIGSYNPNTNPATIDLDFDKALDWLQKGAQPTDTVRAILSYKGVLYKNHLLGGVKKGAFSEEEAEKKFDAWLAEKEAKIQAKKDRLANELETAVNKQLEAESKINEERAAAISARNAELAAEVEAAKAAAKAEAEAAAAEQVAEEAKPEEVVEKATEAEAAPEEPKAEEATEAKPEKSKEVVEEKSEPAPEEPKAEEVKEEKAEPAPEEPKAEESSEEEKKDK